ncbi:serine/threonine-protein kinase [Enhygromyxa salina]|nr:serine/threonine-protein kinase [Enhygromyxa salina]
MRAGRLRPDPLDREQVAAEVGAVLFGVDSPVSVGRFEVESRIGSGGMGVVYRGYDPELDRRVAIKLVDLRRVGANTDEARTRSSSEARALARLKHPNVVAVHDVGVLDSDRLHPRLYLVMEHVDGPTLREWMTVTRPLAERMKILVESGRGLAACHAAELVHGDFKPENILIGADGRARVADFGLALPVFALDHPAARPQERGETRPLAPEGLADTAESDQYSTQPDFTLSGVFGTPAYIAPEQFRGQKVDARADQFSFCVVACELIYGQRPFAGVSLATLAAAAQAGELVELDLDRAPRSIWAVIRKGLAPAPDDRFASMDELLAALDAALAEPVRRRRVAIAAGLSLMLLAAGGFVARAWQLGSAGPELAPQPSCVAAEDRIVTVWQPERIDTITARLADAERLGGASAALVTAQINTYVDSWASAWTQACDPGQTAASRERMHACLDGRLLELGAVLDVLDDPPAQLSAPLATLSTLTPVATCLDADDLDAERPVPPAPELRRAVEQVRNQLLSASYIAANGADHDRALALAREGLKQATELGFRPLEAEAELQLGRALWHADEFDAAADMIERAHRSAQAARHATALADAALTRVQIAYQVADFPAARTWLLDATAAIEATGGDGDRSVQLHVAECMLEMMAGAYLRAVEPCEVAQGLIDGGVPVDAKTQLSVVANLATAELSAGLLDRADTHFAESVAVLHARFGPNHIKLATLTLNWGHVAFEQGDYELARSRYQTALDQLERLGNADSSTAHAVLVGLGDAELELGDLDQAEAAYAEAASIGARTGDYWGAHSGQNGLGRVALARGDHRAALAIWSAQLDQATEQLDAHHPWRIDLEVNVAQAQILVGREQLGFAALDAAIAKLEARFGPEHRELIDDLQVRAWVARHTGRWRTCVADLGRAAAIEAREHGPSSARLASIHAELDACERRVPAQGRSR